MENSEADRVYKDALNKMRERRGTVSLFTNEQLKSVEDNENYNVCSSPHPAGRCPTMKSANSNINYKRVMEIKFAAMAAVKASTGS